MPALMLPAGPESPGLARGFVATWLTAWGVDHLCERALLAASELVTNAVVHARLPFEIELDTDGDEVRITVTDAAHKEPRARSVGPTAVGGRGLRIVEELADEWGSHRIAGNGKAVWCTFRVS